MGKSGGKYIRQTFTCAVAILREEKGMLIEGIEVGRYSKLTRSDLARELGLNGNLTEVTCQVEKIQGNYDTLASTFVLTEE